MKKIFILTLLVLLIPNINFAQCGTPDISVQEYRNMIREKSGNLKSVIPNELDVRLYVWLVKEDDGSGGADMDFAEEVMPDVKLKFEEFNINIDYRINELWDSNRIHTDDGDERQYTHDCQAYNLLLYNSHTDGALGRAKIAGTSCWSIEEFEVIVHEMGHMFGLVHTWTNTECANQYCDCTDCDLEYYEIDNGDGLCDTPADFSTLFFNNTECISNNSQEIRDPCGELYSDPNSILQLNFMSRSRLSCKSEFTRGQNLRMLNTINLLHQSRLGTFSIHTPLVVSGFNNTNSFIDQDLVFKDQSFHFVSNPLFKDSKITFDNCNLTFGENVFLKLRNSDLTLDNGTLLQGGQTCNSGEFEGIIASGHSRLFLENGSRIKSRVPISIEGDKAQTRKSFLFLRVTNSSIESTGSTAINSVLGTTFVWSQFSEFSGAITMTDDEIYSPYWGPQVLALRQSSIKQGNQHSVGGVFIDQGSIALNDGSSILGFSQPLIVNRGGQARIDRSYIEAIGGTTFGVELWSCYAVDINNSIFKNSFLRIRDALNYSVKSSKFDNCLKSFI